MPKAILEYQLPEDREAYDIAMKGIDYYCILHDIYNFRRHLRKYSEQESFTREELIQKLDELLRDFDL